MSFVLILVAVVFVLIILSIILAALKFLFALLPLALVVAGIIWLIYYISTHSKERPQSSPTSNGRRKPKNVSREDIDNKKE